MYRFFITLHARPANIAAGSDISPAGRSLTTLSVDPTALASTLFACTFEEASDRLSSLERMAVEPDGSFVWASPAAEPAWQVDGNLYDRNDHLLFVDLKGSCPAAAFDRLLTALGWPEQAVLIQLTREAAFLELADFRRFAEENR